MEFNRTIISSRFKQSVPSIITSNPKEIREWKTKYSHIDNQIRSWMQQYEEKQQLESNCNRWLQSLKQRIPTGLYDGKTCVDTFNITITAPIADNLNHIVSLHDLKQGDDHKSQPDNA